MVCPVAVWLPVRHTVRGVKRGWLMHSDSDSVTRLRREKSPHAFAFGVVALAAVGALVSLGLRTPVRVFAALG